MPKETFEYQKTLPSIEISWKGSGSAGKYILQIASRSGASPEVATYLVKNRTSFLFHPPRAGRYRWWVAGFGPNGEPTQPGPARTFVVTHAKTDVANFDPPDLLRPAQGQILTVEAPPARVMLTWSKRPVTRYQIELAQDPGFKSKLKGLQGPRTSSQVEIAKEGTVYWRVRGREPETVWSRTQSFRIALSRAEPPGVETPKVSHTESAQVESDPPAPGPEATEPSKVLDLSAKPRLQAPGNRTYIVGSGPRRVLLFWAPLAGAAAYEVVLSSSDDFSQVILRKKVGKSMMALPNPPKRSVFWKVRALNAEGHSGAWSATWEFRYQEQNIWE